MIVRLILLLLISVILSVTTQTTKAEYADIVLNRYSEKADMRPVIFSHWFHRARFRCKVCHSELGFKMRVGSNDVKMQEIIDGKFCGMCHNGKIAWSPEYCDRCHTGKAGLKTGIKGGHSTTGPSEW